MALIQNKPEFIEIILETGLVLENFLTKRRLYLLYNSFYVISFFIISLIFIIKSLKLKNNSI